MKALNIVTIGTASVLTQGPNVATLSEADFVLYRAWA